MPWRTYWLSVVRSAPQEKAPRRAARQERERLLLGIGQFALAAIGAEQRAGLGGVEGMIRLETPGVEADRDVVGQNVVAGERKIDQARQFVAEEEHIVGKQISMDDADRQVAGPARLEMIELARDEIAQTGLHAIGARSGQIEQRPPTRDRERIFPDQRKITSGEMHPGERLADTAAMRGVGPPRPHP